MVIGLLSEETIAAPRTCSRLLWPGDVHFSKALFVPSMSSYNRVDSALSSVQTDITKDVKWQSVLKGIWEKLIHGEDVIHDDVSFRKTRIDLPTYRFLHEDPLKNCDPKSGEFLCAAVIPSLPMTLQWLRDCAKENPSFRLQVLVTGSLHFVGDLLKLLRR